MIHRQAGTEPDCSLKMSLAKIIKQVRANAGHRDQWLLIHGDPADLSLSTDCALSRVEIDEDSEDFDEILPAEYVERGLESTIDYETLQKCVDWADQLSGTQNDVAAADIIRYYIRFGERERGHSTLLKK